MGTSKAMVARAAKDLGLKEPNYIQANYRERNGRAYAGNFPWCQAAVTEWAHGSNNVKACLPKGDRAYTPYAAQDFQKIGRYHSGTVENIKKYAKPGSPVWFDWDGSNTISKIDHVGVIVRVLSDGRVETIEGNTSNVCARRVRSASVIAGFGVPAFDAPTPAPKSVGKPKLTVPPGSPMLVRGMLNSQHVRQLQNALNVLRNAKLVTDGDFGPRTDAAFRSFQRAKGLQVDGKYGPKSAAALKKMAK